MTPAIPDCTNASFWSSFHLRRCWVDILCLSSSHLGKCVEIHVAATETFVSGVSRFCFCGHKLSAMKTTFLVIDEKISCWEIQFKTHQHRHRIRKTRDDVQPKKKQWKSWTIHLEFGKWHGVCMVWNWVPYPMKCPKGLFRHSVVNNGETCGRTILLVLHT